MVRGQRAAQRGGPAADPRRVPARAAGPRAPRARRGAGASPTAWADRLHLPRQRAVLRRLQPHPHHGRGQAAHLPVLDDTRPTCASRCAPARRRRARADRPRRGVGARSSSTTSTTRASSAGAHDVADRRMRATPRAGRRGGAGLGPRGARAAGRRASPRSPTPRDGSLAGPARTAVDLPPFDRSAMDGFARARGRHARAARCASPATSRPGGGARRRSTPGTAVRISTGAAIPRRRRRGPARRGRRGRRRRRARPSAAAGPHVRFRGEDVRAGDVLARRATALDAPAPVRARLRGRRHGRACHRRAALRVIVTGDELLPPGAPPEPGKIHESNGAGGRASGARARAPRSTTSAVVGDDARRRRPPSRRGWSGRRPARLRRRVRRPARPRQARLRGLRRGGGPLACRIKPGKPLWFGAPRPHAGLRPAGQPAVEPSSASALRRAGAAPPAGRGGGPCPRWSPAASAGRPGPRRSHDVARRDVRARRRRRPGGDARPPARART